MGGNRLQLALRETQLHFRDRRVLASVAVVALLLGIAGPFGTFELLETGPRIAYWAAIALSTYGLGFLTGAVLEQSFAPAIPNRWARVALFGAATGVPVTIAVMAVNMLAFGTAGLHPLGLWLQCTLIGVGVVAIGEIHERAAPAVVDGAAAAPPPILDRLPLPVRGELWALVVQDHYVEVVTNRGGSLVLMRLGDAIRETGAVAGTRIHRSHWVARAAVARVLRVEGKPYVELPDGRRLAISRSQLAAARQAGLGA